MKNDSFAPPEYKEGIEADAVCSQCGSINPEGTLICKTCGNNLRDQRLLRLTADQMMEAEGEIADKPTFLIRALTILALLIILYFGLNAGRIASFLTTAEEGGLESTIVTQPQLFWNDTETTRYQAMKSTLDAVYPSPAQAESARLNTMPLSQVEGGTYVLFERLGTGLRFAGAAVIKMEGNMWHFVAALTDGVEIRGKAVYDNRLFLTQWDQAGANFNEEFFAVTGVASLQEDGSITISGQYDANNLRYQAVAYRLGGS